MDRTRFRTLLDEAILAADPRSGGLLDYRDLQQLLRRVATETSALLDERDALGDRLTRNLGVPADRPAPPVPRRRPSEAPQVLSGRHQ
jgi:hypothetical protein